MYSTRMQQTEMEPAARKAARMCAAVCCLVLGLAAPAGAVDLLEGLDPGGAGVVVDVIDGDTVVLDDGREVRMVGTQAPKLPLGRTNFPEWPLADEARDYLIAIALGETVELGYGGLRMDRHGRVLAHMFRADNGLWLQGEMLEQGLARVYTFPDNRSVVDDLLERERAAREAGRGIWQLDYYAIRTPDELVDGTDDYVGTFQLVEGVVVDAADVRGRIFVNFGDDYRTDFTIVIEPEFSDAFDDADYDPLDLPGTRVRVRGWVDEWNGPSIDVTHPEQIEVLE